VICWSCERDAGVELTCPACQALQPPDAAADAFAVLGVPARYAVDLEAAEAAYKRLSRQVHPDRFATADPRARRASLARTVQLNDAWRTLKDPVRRATYMLARAGVDIGDENKSGEGGSKLKPAQAFLMEMLELNDELAEAAGDGGRLAGMTSTLRERAAATMARIAEGLESGSPARLDAAAQELASLRYYQRLLDQAEAHQERAEERAEARAAEQGSTHG
jgi:molecular chaperone HscB